MYSAADGPTESTRRQGETSKRSIIQSEWSERVKILVVVKIDATEVGDGFHVNSRSDAYDKHMYRTVSTLSQSRWGKRYVVPLRSFARSWVQRGDMRYQSGF